MADDGTTRSTQKENLKETYAPKSTKKKPVPASKKPKKGK